MRFEPPEFTDSGENSQKETPLFRVGISHHPVVMYLFLCVIFFCAYRLGEHLITGDPYSVILQVFLAGWALFLLLFCISALMYLNNRIEVTDRRIHGHMFSLVNHRFSVPLSDITEVRVSQLFFAGPLHYGRITLKMSRKRIYILYVKEPAEVKKAIDRAIKAHKSMTH